ncbi:hypothetical protein [Haloarcula laminariae]|uniref:hypothetical protein n=1 Tax=Haloarcula laminariae TaxID=2961577 RepID=UPI0024067013|nr:hypothetical protein [Halomicroarcula sp. FL173]
MTLYSRRDPRPPLPDWVQAAFETLEPHLEEADAGIPRADAHGRLLADCDSIENDTDASRALQRLLERGWLYEVDDIIRKTE